MPSMSSLLRGAAVTNSNTGGGGGVRKSPVDGVHDDNAGVLALSGGEVLQQGQLDAAVVVVREIVHARVADPVVQHLFACDAAGDTRKSAGDDKDAAWPRR